MKVVKNYLYTITYQLLLIIVPIVTIPYISRTLGAENIGLNAFTTSIMSYFLLLSNLGLSLYGNREIAYYRFEKKMRSKIFWEIMTLKFAMMIVSYFIFLVFLFFYGKYSSILLFQSLQLFAVAIDISWYFTGKEDFKKTVFRNIFIKIFSVILIFIFVKNTNDLKIYILILALSNILGNLTLWSYLKNEINKFSFKNFSVIIHIKPVLILFLPQVSTSIFLSINRLYLGNFSSLVQTGFYDNSDKIIRVFLTLITSIGTVLFPRIANYFYKDNINEMNNTVKIAFDIVSLISFPLVFGIIIVSKPFSILFYGSSFSGINIILSIMAIQLIFMGWSSIIGQQYLIAINQIKGLTLSMIFAIIVQVIGSYFLIQKYNSFGAAIMSVIAELIIAIVQFYYVKKFIDLTFLLSDIWKFFVSGIAMMFVCNILNNLIVLSNLSTIIINAIVGAVVYVIFLILLKVSILNKLFDLIKK